MPRSTRLKVTVLSESRADYGILYPLLKAMWADKRFEPHLVASGMHLDKSRGYTCNEIEFPWSMAYCVMDWLVVLGDRRDMLEAAIAAAYGRIPVAHIQGGDRTGTIDDCARHAITRFAHLHFPCTAQSARRLKRMGEEDWRIKVVGPLGIYAMQNELMNKGAICDILGLDEKREIVLVIQHPVSSQVDKAGEQMRQTLEAVKQWQTVVIYPNDDAGSKAMVQEIETAKLPHVFRSLPYLQFISLLQNADVVVGNSSCGLYEAPLFGLPCVNIGDRQQNREHGNNVFPAPHDGSAIAWAVDQAKAIGKQVGRNPFAVKVDGVKVILDTLAETEINERLLNKHVTY